MIRKNNNSQTKWKVRQSTDLRKTKDLPTDRGTCRAQRTMRHDDSETELQWTRWQLWSFMKKAREQLQNGHSRIWLWGREGGDTGGVSQRGVPTWCITGPSPPPLTSASSQRWGRSQSDHIYHLQSNQKEDNTTLKTVNLTAQSLKGQEGFTVKMNFSQNALTCDRVLTETSPRKSSLSHMINITNGQTVRGLENCNICWKRTVWRPHKSLGAGVLIICRRRKNRKIGEEKRK